MCPGETARNLLDNGDFSVMENGQPSGWRVVGEQRVSVEGEGRALRVDIVKDEGSNYGQIYQTIPVKANTRYRLEGRLKGSAKRVAVFQIKRRRGRTELERIASDVSDLEWKTVNRTFNSLDADNVLILCRFRQSGKEVGQTAWFDDVSLVDATGLPREAEHEPVAVTTFESIGLYWKPREGSESNTCRVRYRREGASQWKEALPLWFDPNTHAGRPQNSEEYRGSIVHLRPGTTYEVELKLEQVGTTRTLKAATWNETFKIKKVVRVPGQMAGTYEIPEGGSEAEGYVLYEPAPGTRAVWDAKNKAECNIRVKRPYVILRNLTLKNAQANGIELDDTHHVVIEDCDISGWGRVLPDGFGHNGDAAVYGNSSTLEHIVIQRCRLHDPRSHSNSWNEERTRGGGDKTCHPMGAQGIFLRKGKGRYVIRHNRIASDANHMFNDAMGEYNNFSFGGFPNRDSDIYGNFISHCCDDGLEIEGANMNVRVWNNCTDVTMMSIAGATTSLGPAYFWRNLSLRSRNGPTQDYKGAKGGGFFKLGNEDPRWTGGAMYILHNTVLQPPPWPGQNEPSGTRFGIVLTSSKNRQRNIVTRNNILDCSRDKYNAIRDERKQPSNDFDYDLYYGAIKARDGSERHGIEGKPEYELAPNGVPHLEPGTPGHDAGCRLPNFNDGYEGEAPDMGAFETGSTNGLPATWPDLAPYVR
jgi:hypothetical protein